MLAVINTTFEYTSCCVFLLLSLFYFILFFVYFPGTLRLSLQYSKMADKIQCRLTQMGACWAG